MSDFFLLMWKPLLACLILTGIHTYLGIHVIERKVIFVDLALAQIAALGAVVAFMFGFSLHGQATYWFSLGATFIGAIIFSLTRMRREKIPQEAIIGIVYAVSAAAAILILSRAAEGDEEIRHMLVGNILLVDMREIVTMALLYGLVGFFHWKFRKNFLLISIKPEEAYHKGIRVKGWDILFYLTFGLVVTSSVRIAGVLLVFSFLIVPAVGAILFSDKIASRLFLGWIYGVIASITGIGMSYYFDLPTGATVICVFGGLLVLLTLLKAVIFKSAS
ncbi:MAG: metal ABC transporter permease [Candidatus Omnitrophica bacterium]|nr:metal ABC transporter permease [Candidatus Omnitrophota bacterium]MDD5670716.1 metal ABC transporter permease [Candidatus Omnitrophota bacterium]